MDSRASISLPDQDNDDDNNNNGQLDLSTWPLEPGKGKFRGHMTTSEPPLVGALTFTLILGGPQGPGAGRYLDTLRVRPGPLCLLYTDPGFKTHPSTPVVVVEGVVVGFLYLCSRSKKM